MIIKNNKNEMQTNERSLITASAAHLASRMNNLKMNQNFKLNPWWKLLIQTQKTAMMTSHNPSKLFKKSPQFKSIVHQSLKSLNPRFQLNGSTLKMISTTIMTWSLQTRTTKKRCGISKWKLKTSLTVWVKTNNWRSCHQRQVKDRKEHDFTNS